MGPRYGCTIWEDYLVKGPHHFFSGGRITFLTYLTKNRCVDIGCAFKYRAPLALLVKKWHCHSPIWSLPHRCQNTTCASLEGLGLTVQHYYSNKLHLSLYLPNFRETRANRVEHRNTKSIRVLISF